MTAQEARTAELGSYDTPDEVRDIPHGRVEVLHLNAGTVGRMVLHPGWQWSQDVRPIAGTEWCQAPHFQYHVAGTLHVRMSSGDEFDIGPGQVSYLPEGHDAWVVGDEDAIIVDWAAASNYAKGE